MDIEEKIRLLETEYIKYAESSDEKGRPNKELNLEVYIILKNEKKFTFVFSKFVCVDYKNKVLIFFKGDKLIKIKFSEIYNICYI